MAEFYTILTAIGKAKIANSTVLGTKVNFAKLKVGDGIGSYYEPTESQTALKNVVWEGNVNNIKTGGETNPNWIVTQTVIPPTVGGFTVREAGIFDEADNLLAISKYPESYKPKMEDGSTSDLTIELIFEVSNASSVTLKVDPLVITASKKDVQDLDAKIQLQIEATNAQLSDVAHKTGTIQTNLNADMVDGIQGNQIPLKTTANITYYVNTSTGLDTNDGLTSGTAFKTIAKAISMIPQVVNHSITINVASGAYDETVQLNGYIGSGIINLFGDTVASSTRSFKNINITRCSCIVDVRGFATTTTTNHDVVIGRCSGVILEYMNLIIANANTGLYSDYSNVYANHNVISNKGTGILSFVCGNILAQGNSGTGNGIALNAVYGGVISKDSNSISGTTQEQTGAGGVIR